MQLPYTVKAKKAIDIAGKMSKSLHHNYIGTEHLLIGLLKENSGVAAKILNENGVELDKIVDLIKELIAPAEGTAVAESDGYSPRAAKVLENAEKEAVRFHADAIGTEHILIAMIKETDREFIGKEWTGWLNSRRIRYYIRIRQNFWIVKPSTGERIRAWWLFNDLKVGQEKFFHKLFLHKGEYVYLAGSRIKNSDGVPELQILICFNRPEGAILTYKKRWEIETAFRAMKSSGFNIEDTHMRDMERIARLVAMVCVALVWAYLVGEHKDINIKPIRILKHGRKAKSLVKYGLEEIATILLRPAYTPKFDVFKFLSCT